MKPKNTYTAIGLMSGTSLDGLDVAFCTFTKSKKGWSYTIMDAKTFPYNKNTKCVLQCAQQLGAEGIWQLHLTFGIFLAKSVNSFLKDKKYKIDIIGSHGHTVFHQPKNWFTCQVGSGASIAAITNITTACDFRSADVALGGQGAPLVPIGDKLLFSKYQACLNIGGIANISFTSPIPNPSQREGSFSPSGRRKRGVRVAFDVCPANLVFNFYAQQKGKPYDEGGKLASAGKINREVLKKLNALTFYKTFNSKSLGREWIEEYIIAKLEKSNLSLKDKLATAAEHGAFQVAKVLNRFKIKNVLITGGGAYNTHFINRIKHYTKCKLIIPDDKTIQFKEALIFAFLGVLRLREETNVLKSVTGASRNSCSGALYLGTGRR
ncbi:MAG: anhydro-N-acetylmuramic acid kinase [Bacteroidia bacterium]